MMKMGYSLSIAGGLKCPAPQVQSGGRMKKIALAVPVLVAAALAVAGCAKGADAGNATLVTNESDLATGDGNVTDAPLTDLNGADLNASDTNLSDTSSNAL
jgi:hypothetical protein